VTVYLLLALFLLLGNAFFVAAEFGLVSARRSAIELRALNGSRVAKITLNAMERVSIMLAGAQLGVTLCSLGLGALGEPIMSRLLEAPYHALGLPEVFLHPVSFAIALVLITYLHVVFGEMLPKNIALATPERIALIFTPPLVLFVKVFYPAVVGLNQLAILCAKLVGIHPKNEIASSFTRDEVAGFVEESHREGLLSEDEEHLLSGSLEFDERNLQSVILPAETLQMVTSSNTPADVEELVAKSGYSRFPVQGKKGNLIGYVHLKDMLNIPTTGRHHSIPRKNIRKLVNLKVQDSLRDALLEMQLAGVHVAEVFNNRGRSLGVVMLEDILEELVGEIRDDSRKESKT
jgi:CBS domain containing-hemolysin-like protein